MTDRRPARGGLRNLTDALRVQVGMRATQGHVLQSVAGALMVGAIVVGVAACGVNGSAGGGAGQAGSVQPQPSGTTVTVSRQPRPGSLSPAPVAHSGHRTITADKSGRVTLTTSDDGATVKVMSGQEITVVLGGQGTLQWTKPRLAGPAAAVLRQLSASGGYPSQTAARATFRAAQAGSAVILSSTDAKCLHAHPACAIPERLWRVTVVVR
ncbi:MAG: hypothetical protein LBV34_08860 [Nocardiopsaceae bacterium]|jgi:hypothetical protein|nr:hypothetical protein [Nocardiopsaceae bacterium]